MAKPGRRSAARHPAEGRRHPSRPCVAGRPAVARRSPRPGRHCRRARRLSRARRHRDRAAGPVAGATAFLEGRQAADGGFAEQGRAADAPLTAWAALGLVAGDGSAAARARALGFLHSAGLDASTDADLALRVVALAALGETVPESVRERLRRHRPDVLVNATIWSVLALAAAGERPPPTLVQAILSAQARGGGFPWSRGGSPDSNDTAAAIQALRAAGVGGGGAVARAVKALRAFQNRDGGFSLTKGRESDAQSTAWAIQALLGCRRATGQGSVPVPRAPPAQRRQLPLLGPVRDDARLGDGAGPARARGPPVPASLGTLHSGSTGRAWPFVRLEVGPRGTTIGADDRRARGARREVSVGSGPITTLSTNNPRRRGECEASEGRPDRFRRRPRGARRCGRRRSGSSLGSSQVSYGSQSGRFRIVMRTSAYARTRLFLLGEHAAGGCADRHEWPACPRARALRVAAAGHVCVPGRVRGHDAAAGGPRAHGALVEARPDDVHRRHPRRASDRRPRLPAGIRASSGASAPSRESSPPSAVTRTTSS